MIYGSYVEEAFCSKCKAQYKNDFASVCANCGTSMFRFMSVGRWMWSWKHFWKRVWAAKGHEADNPYLESNT